MATFTRTQDRGNVYRAQAGIKIKTERQDQLPGSPEEYYAKGPNDAEYFACRFDSHGNICDVNGIVVYPSNSGKYPAKKGDKGFFGDFKENYTNDINDPRFAHLPSINDDIYSQK